LVVNTNGKKIIFFGAPGSGKGTQAEMLAKELGLVRISLGDILREEVNRDTAVGKEVKEYMQKGLLVPDELVGRVIQEHIRTGGFVLDGYPRNIGQARELETILKTLGQEIDAVIYLDIDEAAITERLSRRGRGDDKLEVIKKRWQVFQGEAEQILTFYKDKGKLITVDGRGDKYAIFEKIKAVLQ